MAYFKRMLLNIIVGICVFFGIRYLLFLFMPFIVGYIISFLLKPCVTFLEKNLKFKRGLASGISLLFFLSVVGLILTVIVQGIISQGRDLIENFDTIQQNLTSVYRSIETWLGEKVNILPHMIADPMTDFFNSLFSNVLSYVAELFKNSPQRLLNIGKRFFSITLIGVISSFFFMKDYELVNETVVKFTPRSIKEGLRHIKTSSIKVIGGYFATQLKLMTITFSLSLVSLTLLDIGYSLIFAVGIALIDILPFFGSGFFLWPMAVYYIFTKSYVTGILLFATYLVILFTRQFLEPRLLGEKLEVHPLLMLMAMFIGLQIFGIFGLLLGPLSMLIVRQIYKK